MHNAIPVSGQRWLHRADFDNPGFGREDPPGLGNECWEYLESWEEHAEQLIPTPERAQRATAELIAARVRAATGPHALDRELRRTVERQQATITKLLAFVPTRSGMIAEGRLMELSALVEAAAQEIFQVRKVDVILESEPDDDTTACHRVTVKVHVDSAFDVAWFSDRTLDLDGFVVAETSEEEIQALRVFVEPSMDVSEA